MIALPDTAGAHRKTASGDSSLWLQIPASVPMPVVMPVTTPPSGRIARGLAQPLGGIVVVLLVVVVGVTVVVLVAPQTAGPSRRQRCSSCLLHFRFRCPAATQETIAALHCKRHCFRSETASTGGLTTASSSSAASVR